MTYSLIHLAYFLHLQLFLKLNYFPNSFPLHINCLECYYFIITIFLQFSLKLLNYLRTLYWKGFIRSLSTICAIDQILCILLVWQILQGRNLYHFYLLSHFFSFILFYLMNFVGTCKSLIYSCSFSLGVLGVFYLLVYSLFHCYSTIGATEFKLGFQT